jgi:hypothetical protein
MQKSHHYESLPFQLDQTVCSQVRFGLDRLHRASRIRRNAVGVRRRRPTYHDLGSGNRKRLPPNRQAFIPLGF